MVKGWRRDQYRTKLTGKVTFRAKVTVTRLTQAANIVEELNSTREEADTRPILHAAHAAKSGTKAVVVASEDTDVFLLCLAFNHFIRHLCMSSVERRQELDMSVSPVWWQP